jgi:hypothetical protein
LSCVVGGEVYAVAAVDLPVDVTGDDVCDVIAAGASTGTGSCSSVSIAGDDYGVRAASGEGRGLRRMKIRMRMMAEREFEACLLRSSDSVSTIIPLRKDTCCERVRSVTGQQGGRRRGEPRAMTVGIDVCDERRALNARQSQPLGGRGGF